MGTTERKPSGYWSKERVNEQLKQRHEKGLSLAPKCVSLEDGGLYSAGNRAYGSWAKVLEANGFEQMDWYKNELRGVWTEEKIKERLLERKRNGEGLSVGEVTENDLSFFGICKYKYGSWEAVLNLIGETEAGNQKRGNKGYWTKETVKTELLNRKRAGNSMKLTDVNKEDKPLYRKAKEHYGSYDIALAAMEE